MRSNTITLRPRSCSRGLTELHPDDGAQVERPREIMLRTAWQGEPLADKDRPQHKVRLAPPCNSRRDAYCDYYEANEGLVCNRIVLEPKARRTIVPRGGKNGSEVVLVVIEGGGHTWSGREPAGNLG